MGKLVAFLLALVVFAVVCQPAFDAFSKHESVTEMIGKLQWQTLQERRSVSRCGLLSNFREHTLIEELANVLLPPTYISRHDHEDKIREIRAHLEAYRQSFFLRTIRDWNRGK